MRRSRRIFLTTCAVICALAVIAAGVVYLQRDAVEGWLRNRAIALYLRKIAPQLPFTIESFEIRKGNWRDFLNWKIPELALVLRKDDWRARLTGPIEIKRSKAVSKASGKETSTETSLTFKPKITLERISQPLSFGPFDSYIASRIFITGDLRSLDDLADIREAKIAIRPPADTKVAWAPLGIELVEPAFRLDWVAPGGGTLGRTSKYKEAKEGFLLVQASAKAVNWAQPGSTTRMASLVEPGLEAELPLEVFPGQQPPLRVGPEGSFDLRVKSGEVLWDEAYLNVPWSRLPIRGKVRLEGFQPARAEVSIGLERAGIDLSATLRGSPYPLFWRSRGAWQLKDLVASVLEATAGSTGPLAQLGQMRKVTFHKGRIQTRGEVEFTKKDADTYGVSGSTSLSLSGLDLDLPAQAAAIRGLTLDLDANTETGLKGVLEIPNIYFKRAHAKLGRVPFRASPDPGAPLKLFHLKIGEGENLPLEVAGIPFHLGTLTGTYDLRPPADSPEDGPQYELNTHLEVPPLGVEKLSKPFCISSRIPPALLAVRFPRVALSSGTIDPEGTVRLDLFDGQITVSELGLYDLLTDAPEVDFDLDIRGVRLDHLGNWSGLGEVGGTLEGYAHDVTIVSWLPTRFDFRLEAKPYNRSVVVFSPEAMENFIKLIADDAMDQLPGIAKWFFFGFPEKLIGGYDVKYVGISAFSKDGNILLETLDSPEEAKKGNHFILFGPRFKMPLRASHYPLIVDNTAMGNFVRQKFLYLKDMADQKRLEREAAKRDQKKEEKHDDSPETCLPDVLNDHPR